MEPYPQRQRQGREGVKNRAVVLQRQGSVTLFDERENGDFSGRMIEVWDTCRIPFPNGRLF
jgi:hypothetical protein